MSSETHSAPRRRIDRYELLELIGEGGMGAVYRALDTRLGRTVALKTVLSTRAMDGFNQELRQRFMREALAASKVEHRNVVQVIDFGVGEDGTPYLVMEYLRGADLATLLKDSPGPLPIEQVADIMLNVCAALRACHQQGIVHRDLKPSNIFLAETDTGPEVKVLDFGVSKAPMAGDLTQEGQILGTPQYLSPEQVNGKVGPESDQYALGVLLYVCLTKRLPFEEHQNLSLLRAIEVGRFPSPRTYRPEIPASLEAIIFRAMHVDGAARFESVHALGQALWAFASARGQVEWKNYYFHSTPSVSPHQPTLPAVPPRTLERTSILPTPEAGARPQMLVSTRIAKTPQPPGRTPGAGWSDAPEGSSAFQPGGRRGGRSAIWIGAAIVAALLVGGGVVWRGRGEPTRASQPPVANAHADIDPPHAQNDVSPPPPPPPPPLKPEAQVVSPGVNAGQPPPAQPSHGGHPKKRPDRHPPRRPDSPGNSQGGGIDPNGIGIPSS